MASFKVIPPNLKAIQPYLKIADEHEKRDPAITYWCRLYAVQAGLKLTGKSPESNVFFLSLMEWLESFKKAHAGNEAISNEIVAQAHIENYSTKLFLWADGEDREGRFNKNVVKAFYTAGFIYDITNTFGEPSEEVLSHKKYAKWKSTYIHNCLKNGITPIAGPLAMEGEEDYGDESQNIPENRPSNEPTPPQQPQAPYPIGGLFNMPYNNEVLNLPVPGAHAPPSTPNGTNQITPQASAEEVILERERSGNGVILKLEDYLKAQKYCKWAGSALQYEDAPTAIENLQKALSLLTTGQDG